MERQPVPNDKTLKNMSFLYIPLQKILIKTDKMIDCRKKQITSKPDAELHKRLYFATDKRLYFAMDKQRYFAADGQTTGCMHIHKFNRLYSDTVKYGTIEINGLTANCITIKTMFK
jgi:hypothetical protein